MNRRIRLVIELCIPPYLSYIIRKLFLRLVYIREQIVLNSLKIHWILHDLEIIEKLEGFGVHRNQKRLRTLMFFQLLKQIKTLPEHFIPKLQWSTLLITLI